MFNIKLLTVGRILLNIFLSSLHAFLLHIVPRCVVCTAQEEGAPFYHCSGLRRISLLINPGMDPDVPVTVFALNLVCELLLQPSCIFGATRNIFEKLPLYAFEKAWNWNNGRPSQIVTTGGECWNNLLSNLICLSNWQTWLGMKGCSARGIFTRLPADFRSFTIHERDLRHPFTPATLIQIKHAF